MGEHEREVYHEMKAMEKRHFARFNQFQDAIALGKPNNWRSRAGARYMYICEDGLAALLLPSSAAIRASLLEEYTVADIRREYPTEKPCAPYCTVSCVHQVAYFDFFRGKQTLRMEVPAQNLVKITKSGM